MVLYSWSSCLCFPSLEFQLYAIAIFGLFVLFFPPSLIFIYLFIACMWFWWVLNLGPSTEHLLLNRILCVPFWPLLVIFPDPASQPHGGNGCFGLCVFLISFRRLYLFLFYMWVLSLEIHMCTLCALGAWEGQTLQPVAFSSCGS